MKITPHCVRSLLAATLLLFLAPVLVAVPARISITVTDNEGKALEGVTIKVTTTELTDLSLERSTNKRGRATIAVPEGTLFYDFLFEKEGYVALTMNFKVRSGGTDSRTFRLGKQGGTVIPGSGGTVEVGLTPAEEAFNEGIELLQQGDLESAKLKFLQVLGMNEPPAVAHSALASVYVETQEPDAALESVQRFLELEPENSHGYRVLYEVYVALGNSREADRALQKLASLGQGSDSAVLLYNEGVAAMRAGDLAGAEKRYLEALELQPDLKEAAEALMLVSARAGKWEQMAAMAERVLELQPADRRALQARYDAYQASGNEERAEESLRSLAAADPRGVSLDFYESGVERFNAGDIMAATRDLERAVEIFPEFADAHFSLGLCYTNSEEPAKAREHFEKFLALAPDDPKAGTARQMLDFLC